MAKRFIAVYAAAHVYLERFVGFVSQKSELGFQAQGFTDLSLLENYLQKKKIDALLLVLDEASKQAFKENRGFIALMNKIDGIVIMMGRQHGFSEWDAFFKEAGYEGSNRYINRYQSAMQILSYVRSCFPEDQDKASADEENIRPWLAGMYSPVDKVCHPQAAAMIMKNQRKVLYINLEQFSGLFTDCEEEMPGTISDVLYCYRQTPGNLQEVLKKNIRHKFGMDVLIGPEDLADLEELSGEEWPEFLRAAARAGDYHYIFLDMSVFDWKLIDMVLTYGDFYIPALPYDPEKTFRSVLTRKDGSEQELRDLQAARQKAFRQYFTERGLSDQLRKIREVRLESD